MNSSAKMMGTHERAPDRVEDLPRVFVAEDTHVFRLSLGATLATAGLDVTTCPEGVPVVEALRGLPQPPDLLILPIVPTDPATTELVRQLRRDGRCREVPILGFTTVDHSDINLRELRSMGVNGLIDKSCIPESIVSRVKHLVYSNVNRRRFARAPTFMPIDLHVEGVVTSEYALNLAIGGMGMTSSRSLEPNTDVEVRFRLPGQDDEFIAVKGRVIYLREEPVAGAPNELGLFFYPPDERTQQLIAAEVEQLLSE